MSFTILYRHPRRPDEAGMTVVSDQAKATAMRTQLEHRGFQVIKIVPNRTSHLPGHGDQVLSSRRDSGGASSGGRQ